MNKLTKILLLALTLMLVIGASVAVVASANEEAPIPVIKGKNIVYTDMTAIQIAVDPTTVDAKDVKLLATVNDATATYTNYEVSTDSAVAGAYVFTIKGIPASAISDEITFVVESGDKASEPFTYSVAEYFYERLYSDGIINATEGRDAARKEFYETYIANGAAAQELFRNYDKNGNYVGGTTLVTDYNVLAVKDGVLENGREVMLSTDAITSTVTANAALAANKAFTKKWTVTTYGTESSTTEVDNGADVTSNGIVAVTPVYTDATGEYYLSDAKGTRWDFDVITSVEKTDVFEAAKAGTGNVSIFDGSLYLDDGDAQDAAMYAKFYNGTNKNTATCTVFELDFKANQFYGTTPIQIKIANITYSIAYTKDYDSSYGTGHKLCMNSNGANVPLGIPMQEWCTLRFEYYYEGSKLKVFVNNEFVVDIASTSTGARGNSCILYLTGNERKSASNADIYIDNVFTGNILDKPFVAGDPKAAN